jgi:hypothetical protein
MITSGARNIGCGFAPQLVTVSANITSISQNFMATNLCEFKQN